MKRPDITTEVHSERLECETLYPDGLGVNLDELEGQHVTVRGRIMAVRGHKSVHFFDLQNTSGTIQLIADRDALEIDLSRIKRGDIVQVEGDVGRSDSGDSLVFIQDVELIKSSDQILPTAREFAQRSNSPRHLELLMNTEVREAIISRSILLQKVRTYLAGIGMFEIETPIVNTFYNGGMSRPFITRHNTLGTEAFLRSSSEQYLKQMIVAGLDGVFEIGKQFRNEGMSPVHNPEFTLLEVYRAYRDNEWMQRVLEEVCRQVIDNQDDAPFWKGQEISFEAAWPRIPLRTLTAEVLQYDDDSTAYLAEKARQKNVGGTEDQRVVALFEKFVKKQLIQPVYVTGFPASLSPMTKVSEDDPTVSLSYKGYAGGMSLIDGSYEEDDALIQEQNFAMQREAYRIMNVPELPRSTEFIEALRYGMPPVAGASLSIDRLVMIRTGRENITDVMADRAKKIRKSRGDTRLKEINE